MDNKYWLFYIYAKQSRLVDDEIFLQWLQWLVWEFYLSGREQLKEYLNNEQDSELAEKGNKLNEWPHGN